LDQDQEPGRAGGDKAYRGKRAIGNRANHTFFNPILDRSRYLSNNGSTFFALSVQEIQRIFLLCIQSISIGSIRISLKLCPEHRY
jgi:hypothetical protein